jgi:hypothetical protein
MNLIWTAIAWAAALQGGERLVSEGVLGNSGEQEAALVRFGPEPRRGMGVATDRAGSLWDRAGAGVLNRYALDGRLLASYRIPPNEDHNDRVTGVGDLVVARIGGRLFVVPVGAPSGTEAKEIGEAGCISSGSFEKRVAVVNRGKLELLDPQTGDRKAVADVGDAQDVELDARGAAYVMKDWNIRKFADGREITEGWPKKAPGERPQLVGGAWYGHAWHGTIRRFTATLDPDPGVVLGGASGSFIGHLDQNSELVNGRGMAQIRPDLYAVSGMGGVMHLLEWDGVKRQMRIVRRIGAVQVCRGLGLDRKGRVWCHAGSWRWEDGPDAPLDKGVNTPEYPGVGQVVMLPNDSMCAPGLLWGKPTFYRGPLSDEVKSDRIDKGCALRKETTGSVSYGLKGRRVLLAVDASGKGEAFFIGEDGAYQGEAGPAALKASGPAAAWTTLAMKDEGTLSGAASGAVVEMSRDGNDWKETRRWSSWGAGPAEKFGGRLFIAADEGRLWVADTDRHRVLCLDLGTGKPLASFGTCDKAGAGLASLDRPQALAARGRRAVVYDSGNQRLVKLALR